MGTRVGTLGHLHAAAPGVDSPCLAPDGVIDTSFAYGTLTGNPAGNGSSKAKSPTFNWGDATNQYYVDVHDPVTGAPIACGVLARKAPKPHPNGKQLGKAPVGKAPVGKAPKSDKKVK